MSDLQTYAATYQAAGFIPLPILPNSKHPACKGWQTGTAPEAFASHHGNIGLTFGPGLFVLDVDVKNGTNGMDTLEGLEAKQGELPATLTAETPSGGRHYVFRKPESMTLRNRVSVLPGLDVRAAGGFIVAEPSTLDGKGWHWNDWQPDTGEQPEIADAPQWLLAVASKPAPEGAERATSGTDGPADVYTARALERATSAVLNAAEGARNAVLNAAAYGLARLAAAGRLDWGQCELALVRAASATGLEDGEIAATLASAYAAGTAVPNHEGERARAEMESQTRTADNDGRAPVPFDSESPPTPWPDDCLPSGLREATQAIAKHVAAPMALAGMAVLAGVAHIAMRLGDARHPKTGAIPCSLYALSQAKSGDRKSECFKLATAPVAQHERKQREAYKAAVKELEREAANAKPKEAKAILAGAGPDPRTIFTDVTTQRIEYEFINDSKPALSLLTDEGGTLLGGHSLKSDTRAGNLGTLTRLFDGSGVDRGRIGEGQSGFRFGIRFGLFLSAQPVVLRDALGDPLLRDQGFLPRFLFAGPASLAGTRFMDDADLTRRAADDPRIVDYWRALQRMVELPVITDEHGALTLQPVDLDREAIKRWLAFYNDTEARQAKGGDLEHLGAFASRSGELAARVAAVFALWRCCTQGNAPAYAKVSGEDMRRAVALVGYSLAEWQRQGAKSILSDSERAARDLLDWLHRKKLTAVTRTYLAQSGPNALRKDRRLRDDAITELLERHWLREVGGKLEIAPPANANPAKSATAEGGRHSKVSGNSVSNPSTGKCDSDDVEAFDL